MDNKLLFLLIIILIIIFEFKIYLRYECSYEHESKITPKVAKV